MSIQCDHAVEARKIGIILVNKVEKGRSVIDIAINGEKRFTRDKGEGGRYQESKKEIKTPLKLKNEQMATVAIGAPGSLTKGPDIWQKKLGLTIKTGSLLRNCLLRNS